LAGVTINVEAEIITAHSDKKTLFPDISRIDFHFRHQQSRDPNTYQFLLDPYKEFEMKLLRAHDR
jgi:hypothetical protein